MLILKQISIIILIIFRELVGSYAVAYRWCVCHAAASPQLAFYNFKF